MKKPQFILLQRLWYEKLKEEGFNDIENGHEVNPFLKRWDRNFMSPPFRSLTMEETQEYYRAASELLRTHQFKNELERRIWSLHCEGMTERKIAIQIQVYKKSMVHVVIARLSRLIKRK